MSQLNRRNLLQLGFLAAAGTLAGCGPKTTSRDFVTQTSFDLIDFNDPYALIRETIKLLEQTRTGLPLLREYQQNEKPIRPEILGQDNVSFGIVARYQQPTKEILFATAQTYIQGLAATCQDVAARNPQDTMAGERCVDQLDNIGYQLFSAPQPAVLAHELTHAAQDKYGSYEVIQSVFAETHISFGGTLYLLNEILGDVKSVSVSYEIAQMMPDKEGALIHALAMLSQAGDAYGAYSERRLNADVDSADILRAVVSDLIVGAAHTIPVYTQMIRNEYDAVKKVPVMRSDIDPEKLQQYCDIQNEIFSCPGFLTPDYVRNISLDPRDHLKDYPETDERRRLLRVVDDYNRFLQRTAIPSAAPPASTP